ncbi:NAD-dependent epimerase/dehydratase family protein [Pseudomonas sp. zjy_11]|uniref:NAD-dependent epimerase/dehydratase family protein n=1 Tax=unclassified Pseudomonas TaxID=196821 RepID=UPI00370B4065
MHVLVTGAKGFVGGAVLSRFQKETDVELTAAVRKLPSSIDGKASFVAVGNISSETDWSQALQGVDVVVHLAARAHVLNDMQADPLAEFRRVNVEGAVKLLRQAIDNHVKRFVFISSIGVNGNFTTGEPFSEHSIPAPHANYALSKLEAEEALKALAASSGIELVIVRPPLVYAAHAPGNFARLLKLIDLGIPLPFACVRNSRSMVALENLADFIACCARHPAAAGETFLVCDFEDVSLKELLELLARGMDKRLIQLPVPPALIGWAAGLIGKQNLYTQLCRSLQIDSTKSRQLLAWTPPVSAQAALIDTGRRFRQSNR